MATEKDITKAMVRFVNNFGFTQKATAEDFQRMAGEWRTNKGLLSFSPRVIEMATQWVIDNEQFFPVLAKFRGVCMNIHNDVVKDLGDKLDYMQRKIYDDNPPTKEQVEKLANVYRDYEMHEKAKYVMAWYEENAGKERSVVSPEKLAEGRERLNKLAESKRMEA